MPKFVADSAQSTGLKWAAPSSPSFVGWAAYLTASITAITTGTSTFIGFDAEDIDTNTFHNNSTNNTRFTIPTGYGGKYSISIGIQWAAGASSFVKSIGLRKNGSTLSLAPFIGGSDPYFASLTYILDLVAADYIEVYVYQGSGSDKNINGNSYGNGRITYCHGTYLGA